jgi:hypothetical protein
MVRRRGWMDAVFWKRRKLWVISYRNEAVLILSRNAVDSQTTTESDQRFEPREENTYAAGSRMAKDSWKTSALVFIDSTALVAMLAQQCDDVGNATQCRPVPPTGCCRLKYLI